jgi:diguanylate cyclase (GGDEF)-like protein
MRKGRFAGVLSGGGEAAGAPSLGRLLAFDFAVPACPSDARLADERTAFLLAGLPIAGCFHLLWSLLLLSLLYRQTGGVGGTLVPFCLVAILVADSLVPRFASLSRRAARAGIRAVAAHAVLTGLLWIAAAAATNDLFKGNAPLAVRALLVAGAGALIPIVFASPLILCITCLGTVAAAAWLGSDPMLLAIGGGLTILFTALSLFRTREQLAGAAARLALEEEARKARRFVEDFEGSGRGWFWETNADGALTYVSPELARQLGADTEAIAGRRVADVLQLAVAEGEARSLDFHLAARFPFADVMVRPPAGSEIAWALSGKPNFDAYGRFLGFRGLAANLTARERKQAETTKLARYDSLTGLPNRATMARMLDEALANAADRRRGSALMLIDLDRFKQVNDTLGHPVGDQLLKQVAARLRAALGEEGKVGRLGGDEFQAILPGIEEEGALSRLASLVIAEVSKPYDIDGHCVFVGASVGIAVARPGKAYAAGLVKEADLALYAAKADGRGTFRFFDPSMHAEAADRQILERDLTEALGRGELHLLYQPIVETVTEEPVAFEALLRWAHPARGLLLPDIVVPLASECGLMPRIGAWVLRSACSEAARWPRHLRVSVNLSPAEFADPGLPGQVAAALTASGLEAERLELEISEDVFFAENCAGEQVLARLHGLGVRLALDNFGTGRSGLGHLRTAPLDKIKIDQSFVRGAAQAGSRNAAIVRAIVVLAESLGIDTTAEGAETMEELALIRRLGCSQVQGFLFGKPMPAAEAAALARESRPAAEAAAFSRPPRHRLIRSGTLEVGGEKLAVRLRNISNGGAMVECDQSFTPDTTIRLDLEEAGLLDAEVRWSARGQVGMRFALPFTLSRLARRAGTRAVPKVLTPAYLDAPGAAAATAPRADGRSPLIRKVPGKRG